MNKYSFSILALITFFVGLYLGHSLEPTKEQVRTALYTNCVNGDFYNPKANPRYERMQCNRRSIDFMIANIYGDSYIFPMDSAIEIYESELIKFKK